MIDLRPAELATTREILRRHLRDHRVVAFGSRCTGKARKHSDLDLALIGDAPVPAAALARLRSDFDESDLPFRVDVVDLATASSDFRAAVMAAHEDVL